MFFNWEELGRQFCNDRKDNVWRGANRAVESTSLSSMCKAVLCFYHCMVLCNVNELLRQTYSSDTKSASKVFTCHQLQCVRYWSDLVVMVQQSDRGGEICLPPDLLLDQCWLPFQRDWKELFFRHGTVFFQATTFMCCSHVCKDVPVCMCNMTEHTQQCPEV